MLRQLKIKFVVINMSIVTVMLCTIFALVIHFTQAKFEQDNIDMMRAMAAENFDIMRLDSQSDSPRLPFFVLSHGPFGEVTVVSGAYFELSDSDFVRMIHEKSLSTKRDFGVIPEYDLRYLRLESKQLGNEIIFSDISSETRTMENLRHSCLIIGLVSFFLFLAVSILLAQWAVKPVARAWEQQKRFVADASHELKTPLTVIGANAELMIDNCDEQGRMDCAKSILTMTQRMRSLVEDLLELARHDSGMNSMSFTQVDFDETVQRAALDFEVLFFEKGLELCCDVIEPVRLKADAMQLKQLVEILLDNAQKYSSSSGRVELSLRKQGRSALLELSNPASMMPREQLDSIFKRFYRLDPSRTGDGGFGLGLSIAKGIADRHGGRIWADYEDERFCVYLSLPIKE